MSYSLSKKVPDHVLDNAIPRSKLFFNTPKASNACIRVAIPIRSPRVSVEGFFVGEHLSDSYGGEMSVETMQELLIDELKDLYSAEKQIVKALPKLAKAASTPELHDALISHLEETKGQVSRLDKIAELIGKKLTGKTCVGMKGVLDEGSEVLNETDEGTVRDAALIAAAQHVEHYEMAGYGSARDFADTLGLSQVAALLDETLAEEKEADRKLTSISKQVNSTAKQAA
jgi:ferritin-like metal-binding protein YciE